MLLSGAGVLFRMANQPMVGQKTGGNTDKNGLRKAGKVFSQEVRKKDQIVLLYPELDAH